MRALVFYPSLACVMLVSMSHALSKDEVPAGKFYRNPPCGAPRLAGEVDLGWTVSKFVRAKKYKTDAEKYTWSFAFDAFVPEDIKNTIEQRLPSAPWWIPVQNAYWRQPEGKGSGIEKRLNYPAVHISQVDARTFCQWHGWRLPTEAEWEFAARGGLEGKEYPWGNKYEKNRMNIYKGKFPEENTKADGYHGVAPVDAFQPQNEYGLYDMIGNVWEWTSTKFSANPSSKDDAPSPGGEDPSKTRYVLRGGSYIDSKNGKFNHAARVTTRMGNEADAGSDNLGFRCAVSLPTGTSEKKPKGKKKNADKIAKEQTVTELPEGAKVVRPNPADLNGKGKKKQNRNEL
nr:inactive C-alpha-formylglycine-generating enzyme 2-like [Lytechinus pictus]